MKKFLTKIGKAIKSTFNVVVGMVVLLPAFVLLCIALGILYTCKGIGYCGGKFKEALRWVGRNYERLRNDTVS